MEQIQAALQATQSQDQPVRVQAEQYLANARDSNYDQYVAALAQILGSAQVEPIWRQTAGIILKNAIWVEDANLNQRWISLPSNNRDSIKALTLEALKQDQQQVSTSACLVMAAIGIIEMRKGLWEGLIGWLCNEITTNGGLYQMSLYKLLGYLCQDSYEGVLDQYSNAILDVLVKGITQTQSSHLRLAAIKALLNCLYFAQKNFQDQTQRKFIMNVVKAMCGKEGHQTTDNPNQETVNSIREVGFACLLEIGDLYYEYLQEDIGDIFQLSNVAITDKTVTNRDSLALTAMTFWVQIAELEERMEVHLAAVADGTEQAAPFQQTGFGQSSQGQSGSNLKQEKRRDRLPDKQFSFVKQAYQPLMQLIFPLFIEVNEESYQINDWNLVNAAEDLLTSICKLVPGEEIVQIIEQFVSQTSQMGNWVGADSACRVMGCMAEGIPMSLAKTDKYDDVFKRVSNDVTQFLKPICDMFFAPPGAEQALALQQKDQNADVPTYFVFRNTVLAAIDKMCSGCIESIVTNEAEVISVLKGALMIGAEQAEGQQQQQQTQLDQQGDEEDFAILRESAFNAVNNLARVAVDLKDGDDEEEQTAQFGQQQQQKEEEQTNFLSLVIKELFEIILIRGKNMDPVNTHSNVLAWNCLNNMIQGSALDAIPFIAGKVIELANGTSQNIQQLITNKQFALQPAICDQLSEYLTLSANAVDIIRLKTPEMLESCFQLAYNSAQLSISWNEVVKQQIQEALKNGQQQSDDIQVAESGAITILIQSLAVINALINVQQAQFNAQPERLQLCIGLLNYTFNLQEYEDAITQATALLGKIVQISGGAGRDVLNPFLQKTLEITGRIAQTVPTISKFERKIQQAETGLQLSTLSIENVSDYLGVLFEFIMEYDNQLFSQYPTLINVLTTLATTKLYNSPLCSNEALDDCRQGAIEGMTACLRILKDEEFVKKAGNTAVQVSVGGNTVSLTVVELYNQIAGQVWKTIDALIKLQIEESNTADEIEDNLGPNTIEAICQLMLDIAEKMPEQAQQLYNSVTVITFVKQIIKHEENENALAAVKTLRSAMKKLRINI